MMSYSIMAQGAIDSTAIWGSIVVAVGVMLTVAGNSMKRMVDAHFEDRKELKERVAALETKENEFIRQIAQLETKLEQAQNLSVEQKEAHDLTISELKQQHGKALEAKDGEIQRLQQQIDGMKNELSGIQKKLGELNTQHETVVTERNTYRETNEKLAAEATQLQNEIRSLVKNQTMEYDLRRAYERRLLDAGVDTQELEAIKSEIKTEIDKAGDEPL